MKTAFILSLAVILTACSRPEYPGDAQKSNRLLAREDDARMAVRDLVYVKDMRNGLCYAYMHEGSGKSSNASMTNVPCETVQNQLIPQ